ncbi:tetratricopeptide repeat protein [Baaleninema simplex]|uniref:tetratricopeptide repeat protein n=1 Tax=Baaleninema simplex TaxID=2862350 RepID=UPI00034A7A1D|nr:tetratricopeptide repeat protein [Baaleninema simplex]
MSFFDRLTLNTSYRQFNAVRSTLLGGVVALATLTPQMAIAQMVDSLPFPPSQQAENLDRRELFREGNDLFRDRDYEAAEVIFRELRDRYPQDSLVRYKLGNALFAQYRYEEAAEEYQEAIRLNEDHALAYNALGDLRASQGRLEEAVSLYERALEVNEDYVRALKGLGRALARLQQFEEAIATLETALDVLVEEGEIWEAIEVARLLQQVRRWQDVM